MAKGAAAAAVALALAVLPMAARAADSVAPRELEQAVRQTMQSPEYNWRIPPPATAASDTPWIILATDRAIAALHSAVKWMGMEIDQACCGGFSAGWISILLPGGQAPAAALHWSVWVLIGLALALTGWAVWRAIKQRSKKAKDAARPATVSVRLDDEDLTADRLPEAGWLEMAERCLSDGNLRLALRAFYLANLAWLGRHEFLTIDPGRTDREFEVELRRTARHAPEAQKLFSANVRAFERVWYGLHEVLQEEAAGIPPAGGRDEDPFERRGRRMSRAWRSWALALLVGVAAFSGASSASSIASLPRANFIRNSPPCAPTAWAPGCFSTAWGRCLGLPWSAISCRWSFCRATASPWCCWG